MSGLPRLGSALAALLLLTACRDPSSWAVRWRVEARPGMVVEPTTSDDEPELSNSVECSRVGISVIEFSSIGRGCEDLDILSCGNAPACVVGPAGCQAAVADTREKPCFSQALENPNTVVGGPALRPGKYTLIALALRSNGRPWTECFTGEDGFEQCGDVNVLPRCIDGPGGPACEQGYISCDCRFLDVAEDRTQTFRDLVFAAPPECEDGIDGDGDGLVDELDPGCQVGDREDVMIVNAQLFFDISLLSNNVEATCGAVGLRDLVFTLDGEELERRGCATGAVGLNLQIEPGPHEIAIAATSAETNEIATREEAFAIEALPGGVVAPSRIEIDFSDTDFLDPIVTHARFTAGFESHPDAAVRFCDPPTGSLVIPEMSIAVVDAAGNQVRPAPTGAAGSVLEGRRFDGRRVPCSNAATLTNDLTWGTYRVIVEGYSAAGDVCFSNADDPTLLSPAGGNPVAAPRVTPPPASCRDCSSAADCGPGFMCGGGICAPI